MAIIPQEPFLFDDTVEKNLDPEELYTTLELLDVLEKCHLAQVAQKLGRSFTNLGKAVSCGVGALVLLKSITSLGESLIHISK